MKSVRGIAFSLNLFFNDCFICILSLRGWGGGIEGGGSMLWAYYYLIFKCFLISRRDFPTHKVQSCFIPLILQPLGKSQCNILLNTIKITKCHPTINNFTSKPKKNSINLISISFQKRTVINKSFCCFSLNCRTV